MTYIYIQMEVDKLATICRGCNLYIIRNYILAVIVVYLFFMQLNNYSHEQPLTDIFVIGRIED